MMKSILRRFSSSYTCGKPECVTTDRRSPGLGRRALRVEPLEDRRLLAVIAVDSLADGPVNLTDGNTTLRDALAIAADVANPDADEIVFAASLGLDTTPGEIELLAGELLIDSDVTITGPGASQLTIDADGDDNGTGESRVFHVSAGVAATLEGMTVSHGYAVGVGGAIYNNSGTLSIAHCTISDSSSTGSGGGVHTYAGTTTVTECILSDNAADQGAAMATAGGSEVTMTDCVLVDNLATSGGAIYNGSTSTLSISDSEISANSAGTGGGFVNALGTLNVTRCTISDNSATNISGGGIYSSNGTLTVEDSTISGNTADESGGAIYATLNTTTVTECTIIDNSAVDHGGGFYTIDGPAIVTRSTISGNDSGGYGGGITNGVGDLTVTECTISGNTAGNRGGGISNSSGTQTITDSTVLGNSAGTGGGIYNYASTQTITNSTIVGNSSNLGGGGIFCYISGSSTIRNSLVAGNSAGVHGGGIYNHGGTLNLASCTVAGNTAVNYGGGIRGGDVETLDNTLVANNFASGGTDVYDAMDGGSYNLIGDGTDMTGLTDGVDGNQVGTGASPVDPRFVDVQTYTDIIGLDGLFGTADDGPLGDYHLLSSSPAIDTGDNALAIAALTPEDFGEILIDHNDVDITALTQAEMQLAKDSLHIGYAHTSHGSQVTTGMTGLVAFANGGGKGLALPAGFFAYNDGGTGGALDLDDHYGDMGDVGYYPAWENHTRAYLDDAANADVNVMMWSWCGQVDDKWSAGTLGSEYLTPMTQLELDYPNVHFVYMTGHVDHWDDADNKAANQYIRDYCADNDKILYDFADIESYDPDGIYYEFPHDSCDYYASATGSLLGNWATAWQGTHTENVDWYSCSSAHSQPLNANQKAYAAWAMFSEIAALPDLPPMTDLGGNARIFDGDLDGTVTVDIGAYEYHTLVVTTLDDELDVDLSDPNDLSLREALALAADDTLNAGADEIRFSDSLGLETTPGEIELLLGELVIDSDVAIIGPGATQLAVDADADDNGTGESRVFKVNSGVTATLDGLTVSGGYSGSLGGGINNYGTLSVVNSTISNNKSVNSGGGIFSWGDLAVIDSTVSDNSTDNNGGGIDGNIGALVEIVDSTITGNYADNNGGGVYGAGSMTVEIARSVISDNSSDNYGGGVYAYSTLVITDSTVSGNSTYICGGGIYGGQSSTVTGSTITENTALHGAGLYSMRDGLSAVANTIITGNVAGYYGGGVLASYDSTFSLANSTIAGNMAVLGGAIYGQDAALSVAASSIAGNAAEEVGGAIYTSGYSTLSLSSSILWQNAGGELEGGGLLLVDSNLIGFDPRFVRDPSDGGDGWGDDPMTTGVDESANDDYGELHLTAPSPALDYGNDALLPLDTHDLDNDGITAETIPVDLDGNARVFGASVDCGAYEFQDVIASGRETPALVVTTASDTCDLYDLDISLRDAIYYAGTGGLGTTIVFDPALNDATITLDGTAVCIERAVDVDASALDSLTVDADGRSTAIAVVAAEGTAVNLTGLTVTGGGGGSVVATGDGSGIRNASATLTVADSTLAGNTSGWDGGGIMNYWGILTVVDSTITGNEAYWDGGGISSWGSSLTVGNSDISGNDAGSAGGGIFADYGEVFVDNSTISNNWAYWEGGGILGSYFTTAISESVISDNWGGDYGGGIYIPSGGIATITSSTIFGNSVTYDGGGVFIEDQAGVTFTSTAFHGNTADYGGALYCEDFANTTLIGSVFSGNSAEYGGGVYCLWDGSLDITQSTFSGNSADYGGGIFSDYGNVTLANSLFWDNAGDEIGGYGAVSSQSSLIGIDPRFVRDPSDGGDGWGDDPTTTGVDESANDDYGDLRLTGESPAIDYGDDSLLPLDDEDLDDDGITSEPLPLDLNGNARIFGAAVDCGAFEYQSPIAAGRETPSFVVTTSNDTFDLYDGAVSLREALYYAGTAAPGTTVTFDVGLNTSTIALNGTAVFVDKSVAVDASSLDALTVDAQGQSRVFDIIGPDTQQAALIGLTMTGGTAEAGGAIYNSSAELTVSGSTISGNSAVAYGGGLFDFGGLVTIADSTVSYNSSLDEGGGLYSDGGTLAVIDSTISHNTADCGGGASVEYTMLSVTNSTVSDNQADSAGAIAASHSEMAITASAISSNAATVSGGGVATSYGNLAITDSTISENTAQRGGGIDSRSSTTSIVNSLISDNSVVDYGGGIYVQYGDLILASSTVAGNFTTGAAGEGGGIYVHGDTQDAGFFNSLIAGNLATVNGPDVLDDSAALSGYRSLIGDGSGQTALVDGSDGNRVGTTAAPIDPLFVDDAGGDYRLLAGSPALDGGSNLYLDEVDSDGAGSDQEIDLDGSGVIGDYTITTDLAGGPRILNAVVDIGAFEGETSTVHELFLEGTENADTISIAIGASEFVVTINSVVTTYDTAVYDTIHFDGLGNVGGNDQITILGTDQDEIVTIDPGSVDVDGETYEIHASNVEDVTMNAGTGDDQVTMTGSTGSNRLYSYADYARLTDSPRTLSYRVDGFDTVTVEAPGSGRDYAFLYDSPAGDVLDADPAQVVLTHNAGAAEETVMTAEGFQRIYAYATQGGTDTATLAGAVGTGNRFYSYADYSILTESRRSFYFYARGFDDVTGNSSGTATTCAYLYDSPGDDTFEAATTSATMNRDDGWFDATATGFKRIYAYATRGGSDTATLNGSATGGNHYRGYPTYSTLTDAARTFYHYARGFTSVTAVGSQTDPSGDRAYLYDSSGNDTFDEKFLEGGKYQGGSLTDGTDTTAGTYENFVKYFDLVYARSTDSGTNDTIAVDDEELLAYMLIRSGTW